MGTIGGSISFADPGLDYPPALVAAGASIEIAGTAGRRRVAAADFFVDWYTTALEPGEIVTAVLLAGTRAGGAAYVKHARVAGDYATASAAVCIDAAGPVRAAIGSCGPTPVRDDDADVLLSADRGSAGYRRLLIPRLLLRAVRRAEASTDA
jgi:carbon-monoxide dehydrogenase medium subunit